MCARNALSRVCKIEAATTKHFPIESQNFSINNERDIDIDIMQKQ